MGISEAPEIYVQTLEPRECSSTLGGYLDRRLTVSLYVLIRIVVPVVVRIFFTRKRP